MKRRKIREKDNNNI